MSTEQRLRQAFILPVPSDPPALYFHAQDLVLRHVPIEGKVYVLSDSNIVGGIPAITGHWRLSFFVFPRFVQAIGALPIPSSAEGPALADRPTFILDLRVSPTEPPAGFGLVVSIPAARLYREAEAR